MYKDARFWLAAVIVLLFSALTASVYGKAKTFADAFQLWDSLAVIFSALVGGLLGFTVNYTRAKQAEDKAQKKDIEADAAKDATNKSKQREAMLRPVVDRVIRLADQRSEDRDSAIVLGGATELALPPAPATKELDGSALEGKTFRIADVDPDLLLLADQAREAVSEIDDMR
jgi:hypothetical protein